MSIVGECIMKKTSVYVFILIVCIANAYAISISPASISMDFTPNREEEFLFQTQSGIAADILVEGELAPYITVTQNTIAKNGQFMIKVSLPAMIEKPGENKAYISLMEMGKDGGMVSGIAVFRTPITL